MLDFRFCVAVAVCRRAGARHCCEQFGWVSACVSAARVPVDGWIAVCMYCGMCTCVCGCINADFVAVCVCRYVSVTIRVFWFWTIGLGIYVCVCAARVPVCDCVAVAMNCLIYDS